MKPLSNFLFLLWSTLIISSTSNIQTLKAQTTENQVIPLKLYYHSKLKDFLTMSDIDTDYAQYNQNRGYAPKGIQGYVFSKQVPNTILLKLYYSNQRADFFTATPPMSDADAKRDGYGFTNHFQGYIYAQPQGNTLPLKFYWSEKEQDALTLTSPKLAQQAIEKGYRYIRTVGHVLKELPQTAEMQKPPIETENTAIGGSTISAQKIAAQLFIHKDYNKEEPRAPKKSIGVGQYDFRQLSPISPNNLTSVKIKEGHRVLLFRYRHFLGEFIELNQNSPNLEAYKFNDATSSLIVQPSNTPKWKKKVVALFADVNYQGKYVSLSEGQYDVDFLKKELGNDVLSSIRMLDGYKITLYTHEKFGGNYREITNQRVKDLNTVGFNDQTSSLIIEKKTVSSNDKHDLAMVSWCHSINATQGKITFFPIVKNVSKQIYRNNSERKYSIGVSYNGNSVSDTYVIPRTFTLQAGESKRLPQGITVPLHSNWNYLHAAASTLYADAKDTNLQNDRFQGVFTQQAITGQKLEEDWQHCSCKNKTVGQTWRLNLEQLYTNKVSESTGDDIYFIGIGFRSTLGVAGSTEIFYNQYKNYEWAKGVKADYIRSIPKTMGQMFFRDVPITPISERVEIMGAIVVAMESDDTSWGTVENLVNKTGVTLRNELIDLFEKGNIQLLNQQAMSQQINQAIKKLLDGLKPSVGDIVKELFLVGWDKDDFLDYKAFVFLANQPINGVQFPSFGKGKTDYLQPMDFKNKGKALRFISPKDKEDSDYSVTGDFEAIW